MRANKKNDARKFSNSSMPIISDISYPIMHPVKISIDLYFTIHIYLIIFDLTKPSHHIMALPSDWCPWAACDDIGAHSSKRVSFLQCPCLCQANDCRDRFWVVVRLNDKVTERNNHRSHMMTFFDRFEIQWSTSLPGQQDPSHLGFWPTDVQQQLHLASVLNCFYSFCLGMCIMLQPVSPN